MFAGALGPQREGVEQGTATTQNFYPHTVGGCIQLKAALDRTFRIGRQAVAGHEHITPH